MTDESSHDPSFTRPGQRDLGWLRRLWPFLRPHRLTAGMALVMSVAAQVLIGVLPLIQKVIIDRGIVAGDTPLGPLLVLLVSVGAVGFAANYTRRYLGGKLTVDVQDDMLSLIHI